MKFKCPHCGKEEEIPQYITIFDTFGNKVYKRKSNNKEICCENCNTSMEIVTEKGNFETAGIGRFSSLSPLEKQQLLRKRSREDAKKQNYKGQEEEKLRYNA